MAVKTLLFLFTLSAFAQTDVRETYAKQCAGCHGEDARGTQQGPGLLGSARLRRRSPANLRTIITRGIPAAGMPAFPLPAATLDGLVAMIVSLNATAAEAVIPGDRAAGQAYFAGAGRCATCHLVSGAGSAKGPDLTAVARRLTVEQLRESLLQPGAQVVDGYRQATLQLRDGSVRRGFLRSRSDYDVTLQTPEGRLEPVSLDRVARLTEEPGSAMPALQAPEPVLQNLLAYLGSLKGLEPLRKAPAPSLPGGVDFARLANPRPGDWLTYNGNLSGNRYSPLKEVNTANVRQLSLKWSFTIPLWTQFLPDTPYFRENMRYFGLETVPIVADGIMYATGPNQVLALDALTGQLIWRYGRPRTEGLVSDPSLGTNRGVAILGDHLFFVTDNAHLLALNRLTGTVVWEVTMPDEPQKYGGTIAPLIVKDMVIAGVAGGDWGIRGFLDAYDAGTGQRRWRHWTVPTAGEPGAETWQGTSYKLGGGATWFTGSYDPASDTLYWATGNPWPNSDDRERGGDNLYTDCVLALDPNTGQRKWHYQFTPHDVRDWDATEPNVLVDTVYRGQPRKLLLHADRNGFFYVFDRLKGELLLAKSFLHRLTWASGIGPDGRPVLSPPSNLSCPEHATNWNGTAYSPVTRLYYVMASEKCRVQLLPGSWKTALPPEDPGKKYLRALDIETGRIVWEVPQTGPVDGKRVAGILGTAGGLLFYGDASGYFIAADERTGKTLWRLPLNATIKTSPMTFTAGGRQYISLAVGANILTFGLP
ncbi:MAG: PQQ-binding-like beta-propeller repeat protein [Bryobacteraceae bacterium]|nr:PQQ-binding-like beta-propeller repeat protein [Bryobacteraceae bacterium]